VSSLSTCLVMRHPTAVAHSVLTRIKDDVAAYADVANHSPVTKINQISDLDVHNYFACVQGSKNYARSSSIGEILDPKIISTKRF